MYSPTRKPWVESTGTRIHRVRSKAGIVKNLPLYSLENKKKRITQAKSGSTISKGSTLVESNAARISETPPVNVSELAPRYAGTASIRKGEMTIGPRKSGRSQRASCLFFT